MKENKYYQLFATHTKEDDLTIRAEEAKNSVEAPFCRIPTMISVADGEVERIITMCDISQSGGDHGRIQVVSRTSTDGGETFSDMEVVLSLPVAKASQIGSQDHRCAFAIDPILVQCSGGDLLMIVDMFPESKAIMHKPWLEKGHGHVTVDGKTYLALYEGKTTVGGGKSTLNLSKAYTVREKGWVYTPDGKKTKYYVPQKHSFECAFETMGDMYYCVGYEGEYIDCAPPMMPVSGGGHDIYVGNIYLNEDKPDFSADNPVAVTKRGVYDDKEKYPCTEAGPAPLSVLPSLHLWVLRSKDKGRTWGAPVDITAQVKSDNEIFLGTGPGVAIRLQNQKDSVKNGRIIAPVYNLKDTFVIYSDDEGTTWHRSASTKNIDETQVIEDKEGTLWCFGRQLMLDRTPTSVSYDGGETWKKVKATDLTGVRCQKSVITLPKCDDAFPYPEGMDKDKTYVVASTTTGHYQKKSDRFGGVITLGVIEGEEIRWLKQRKIITDCIEGKHKNFYAYSSLEILNKGEIGLLYEALPASLICFKSF